MVIPCYNVGSKLKRCLASLDALYERLGGEVILVDDCSTDDTYERLLEFCTNRAWAHAFQLEKNSGSPSAPRNLGLTKASGDYIIYLDSDDEIIVEGVAAALSLAESSGADLVRAPLIRFDGSKSVVMNQIDCWSGLSGKHAKAKAVVRFHSTTPTAVYSRRFLVRNRLLWPTDLHMAEDAVFLYSALSIGTVEYSPEPIYIYHAEIKAGSVSATQRYGDDEMHNHVLAWSRSQRILEKVGIDFFATRGQVALQAVFENIIKFNREGFSKTILREFAQLLQKHRSTIQSYSYGSRFAELRDLLLSGELNTFQEAIKPRMVVAGYDLKFITPSFEILSKYYQIQVDEWTAHDEHNENKSSQLLRWADVIFCEWMLGNAVWYSKRKLPHQTLVVRLHRFELTKPYGDRVEKANIDRVITIAPAIFEAAQVRFGFDRSRMVYMPNYLPVERYRVGDSKRRAWNLAMVGTLPKLKGLRRALELLKCLREEDDRYKLYLYGKRPEDLPWISSNPTEMQYYEECREFIEKNNLTGSVIFKGWVDTERSLGEMGIVLSLSDLEGSHVAASEGFAAGGISVFRPWNGVEYMYPSKYVFRTLPAMADYILSLRDPAIFARERQEGAEFIRALYGQGNFESDLLRNIPSPKSVR